MAISDEDLRNLERLLDSSIAVPWRAVIEGRDQPLGGESFIQTGPDGSYGPDIYVNAGSFEANSEVLEFLALARTLLPDLLDEVRRGRQTT